MQVSVEYKVKETFFIEGGALGKPIRSEDLHDLLDLFYSMSLLERLKYRQDYRGDLVFWVIKDSEKWGIDEYNYYTLFKKGEVIESKSESTLKDPKHLMMTKPNSEGVYYIIVESEGKQYAVKSKVK